MRLLWCVSIFLILLSGCNESPFDKRIKELQSATYEDNNTAEKNSKSNHKLTLTDVEKKYDQSKIQKEEIIFSNFISQVLFEFYNRQLPPEEYVNLIKKYGVDEDTRINDKHFLLVLHKVQDLLEKQKYKGIAYKNLLLTFTDGAKQEATFYRSIQLNNQEYHYYQTTIQKRGGKWHFIKDQPVTDSKIIDILYAESFSQFNSAK